MLSLGLDKLLKLTNKLLVEPARSFKGSGLDLAAPHDGPLELDLGKALDPCLALRLPRHTDLVHGRKMLSIGYIWRLRL